MFDRLKKFLQDTGAAGSASGGQGVDEVQLAATALLLEAAGRDGTLEAVERAKIESLIAARFEIGPDEIERLLAQGEESLENSNHLLTFTRAIKDNLDHEERIGVLEMLWEVVYSDGILHDYEANLMRRVAGLIYVSDRESGEARKRALSRLGLDG